MGLGLGIRVRGYYVNGLSHGDRNTNMCVCEGITSGVLPLHHIQVCNVQPQNTGDISSGPGDNWVRGLGLGLVAGFARNACIGPSIITTFSIVRPATSPVHLFTMQAHQNLVGGSLRRQDVTAQTKRRFLSSCAEWAEGSGLAFRTLITVQLLQLTTFPWQVVITEQLQHSWMPGEKHGGSA